MKLDLLEAKKYQDEEDIKEGKQILKWIAAVRQNCSEFLNREPSLIYRGIRDDSVVFGRKRVRKNRQPSDMDANIAIAINDAFEDVFGYRLRQESIFASRYYSVATGYGTIDTAIFIPNKYHIVTSKSVNDLYNEIDYIVLISRTEAIKLIKKYCTKKEIDDAGLWALIEEIQSHEREQLLYIDNKNLRDMTIKLYDKRLREYLYKNYDFESNTTEEKNELMIISDNYYYIRANVGFNLNSEKSIKAKFNSTSPKKYLDQLEQFIVNGEYFI